MRNWRNGRRTSAWLIAFAVGGWLLCAASSALAKDAPSTAEKPAAGSSDKHDGDHSHGGGHHDETDLSHANAGEQLTDFKELRSDLAIYTFVVFLLLFVLLAKFAWRPVMQGVEKREQAIADKIEEARVSAEKAAEQLRSYEARLATATEEANKIVGQARRDAEAAKDRILAEAQQLSQRERERAIEDIHAAKNVALREIAQQSVNAAVSLAGRIVHREVKAQDHAQLIREALEQFPSKN